MKLLTISIIFAGACLAPVHASNLVLNPGFETGDFSSWNVTLAAHGTDLDVNGVPNTGTSSAAFGGTTPGSYDTIAQSFNTVAGGSYTFSFFLQVNGGSEEGESARDIPAIDPIADFQAFWNGNMVLDSSLGNTGDFDFTKFSFTVTATGNDTIAFSGYNVPAHYYLDDVSVDKGTPEPATWALLGSGLAAFGAIRRRAR
jgi:hypothetical protein